MEAVFIRVATGPYYRKALLANGKKLSKTRRHRNTMKAFVKVFIMDVFPLITFSETLGPLKKFKWGKASSETKTRRKYSKH